MMRGRLWYEGPGWYGGRDGEWRWVAPLGLSREEALARAPAETAELVPIESLDAALDTGARVWVRSRFGCGEVNAGRHRVGTAARSGNP